MHGDLRKLKTRALRLLDEQKFDKALSAIGSIASAEPSMPRWPQKMGEIRQRLGHATEAVSAYAQAARLYAEQGFLLKAIAICRLILTIDPDHRATQRMLVELYADKSVRPPEVPPSPVEPSEGPPLKRARTIPPGEPLDAVTLATTVADARPHGQSSAPSVEIPLGDEPARGTGNSSAGSTSAVELLRIPLFSSLDERALECLIEKVEVWHFDAGEQIITEGEEGESLFVLAEGSAAVFREGPPRVQVGDLIEGSFFGEIALLTKCKRTATVEAVQEVTVLEISCETIAELVQEHPHVLKVLLRFFRQRLIDTLIETSELFAPLAPDDRCDLVARFAFLEVEAGVSLVQQGQVADGLYVLLCGKLEALCPDGELHEARRLELDPGSVVGERSLLTQAPAEATVTARSKCWLLRLDQPNFQHMVQTHPRVLAVLTGQIEQRRESDGGRDGQDPARRLALI